jgi:hypothetical protein
MTPALDTAPLTYQEICVAVARMRRTARVLLRSRQRWAACSRSARRALARTDSRHGSASIFVRRRLRAVIAEAQQEIRKANDSLRKVGEILMKIIAPIVDHFTSLEQRCDLLNVNVVDRCKLPPSAGIVEIASVHALEDSASTRCDDFKSGPFFESIYLVLVDFLSNHPEGHAVGDTLFEPGGLLASLSCYNRLPDRAMKRRRPVLRIVF